MHKVEIRLSNAGDTVTKDFEIVVERLKDGSYSSVDAPKNVNSEAAPMTFILEDNERIVIVAKSLARKMVFDKEQNANVVVEEELPKVEPKIEPKKPFVPPPAPLKPVTFTPQPKEK